MSSVHNKKLFSVVIPCHNEGENLVIFIPKICEQLDILFNNYEILIINDGSSDNTRDVALGFKNSNIRYIEFSRNFGKEAAIMAGLDKAAGDVVLLIDADFQHPINKIAEMIDLWKSGYQMIYCVIVNRVSEGVLKRLGTKLFYGLMSTSEIIIPENAGDFRLLDRKVVDALKNLPEKNRFMKGLYAWVGFKSIALPFEPKLRNAGYSSFNLKKLTRLALSGLTSFTTLPLQLWVIVGTTISILSIIYGIYLAISTFIYGNLVSGWPTLAVALMLFSGIQLLSIGVLGEYVGRIFAEVKNRPLYIIADEKTTVDKDGLVDIKN
jgi:glycosyltransferase involved in cell wall biosynthesis